MLKWCFYICDFVPDSFEVGTIFASSCRLRNKIDKQSLSRLGRISNRFNILGKVTKYIFQLTQPGSVREHILMVIQLQMR